MSDQEPKEIWVDARGGYASLFEIPEHVKYIRADITDRYRAALERIDLNDHPEGIYALVREALHPTQPAEGSEK